MDRMNFREFTNEIIERIPDYFLTEDIAEISTNKILKNNGVEMSALTIKLVDEQITPNIYLDYRYSQYLDGREISDILSDIRREYTEARNNIYVKDFRYAFETVEPNLFVKLVNYDTNREFLKNCVHERYMDLALTVRYLVRSDENGIASGHVRYQDLENWGMSRTEIVELAKNNTRRLFPPVYDRLDAALAKAMPDVELPEMDVDSVPYVLTNSIGINGAVNMIYPDIVEEISRKNGNKDLYILPSSIHEALFLAAEPGMSVEDLEMMVKEVNRYVVSKQDYLSDSVYKYDVREKCIFPAGLEREKNNDEFER